MTDDYLQVTTTTDSRREAAALAQAAVEARLAACAQLVGPIVSTYWWEDEVETAEEWMVLFKTTAARLEELATLVTDRHSYDTPEIIATPVTAGSADYLDWVSEQTDPDAAQERADDLADDLADGVDFDDGTDLHDEDLDAIEDLEDEDLENEEAVATDTIGRGTGAADAAGSP
jgi:periplasmic divalent cation tolerance protein